MNFYIHVGAIAAALLGRYVKAEKEKCYMSLDVMFLQDSTGSFDDDLPNVMKQLPKMVEDILKSNPNSRFGVAEFKDKPYYPLGEPEGDNRDFCYKLNGGLCSDVDEFCWNYGNIYASGGGDLPEATFQALINIAYDKSIGWRSIVPKSEDPTHAGAHVVIISTDAIPHIAGDIDKMRPTFPDLPKLPANPGTAERNNFNVLCEKYDYPDADQVKAGLELENIYLVILTPEDDDHVVSTWKWVNEELLKQPAEFYQFIDPESKNLLKGVLAALKSVTETACVEPTTTESPTTTLGGPDTPFETPSTTTELPTTVATTLGGPDTTRTTTTELPTTTTELPTATTTTKCPPCGDGKPCCPDLEIIVGENPPKALHVEYQS